MLGKTTLHDYVDKLIAELEEGKLAGNPQTPSWIRAIGISTALSASFGLSGCYSAHEEDAQGSFCDATCGGDFDDDDWSTTAEKIYGECEAYVCEVLNAEECRWETDLEELEPQSSTELNDPPNLAVAVDYVEHDESEMMRFCLDDACVVCDESDDLIENLKSTT